MKVVAIGGGLGAVQVMQGMQRHTRNLTGIIAVTDTGRSTGIVREFAQIPAPGDIRNALATLALDDDSLLTRVMQHRIAAPDDPKLDGMAFGNLFIAALTQMSDSFVTAIEQISEFLDVQANIYPVTEENTHICAELVDGAIVEQEFNVRQLDKAAIKRIFVQNPDATAYGPCLDALREADLITIGPGQPLHYRDRLSRFQRDHTSDSRFGSCESLHLQYDHPAGPDRRLYPVRSCPAGYLLPRYWRAQLCGAQFIRTERGVDGIVCAGEGRCAAADAA